MSVNSRGGSLVCGMTCSISLSISTITGSVWYFSSRILATLREVVESFSFGFQGSRIRYIRNIRAAAAFFLMKYDTSHIGVSYCTVILPHAILNECRNPIADTESIGLSYCDSICTNSCVANYETCFTTFL